MKEVAWTSSADLKANADHEACVLFLPVLCSVACTIQTQIELGNFAFITKLPVLYWNFQVDGPNGLGIKVGAFNI